jgi:LacI family transcriptional regulator
MKMSRPSRSAAKVTMVEVAARAGVAISTVSAVVNDKPIVSESLRARVQRVISDIGYKRNAAARNLKRGATQTIGLIVADITNPFFTDLVAVIEDALRESGYAVMLCNSNGSVETQDAQIKLLLDRGIDGLIVAPACDDANLARIVASAHVKVVLIDRHSSDVRADAVVIDNERASREATAYLLAMGHRRIGFISGSENISTGRERLAGYRAAHKAARVRVSRDYVRMGDFRQQEAYRAAMELLALPNPPTAIFAANNLMAIGSMKAIADSGLECPSDISVACFDDFPWADVFYPQLTTVAQPVTKLGQEAARLMVSRLSGRESSKFKRVVLRGRLVVRTSCAPPRP